MTNRCGSTTNSLLESHIQLKINTNEAEHDICITAHLWEQQSSSMAVQLTDVLLVVVQFLAREGQCLSEHSWAQHLTLLHRWGEEGYKPLLKLRRQPKVDGNSGQWQRCCEKRVWNRNRRMTLMNGKLELFVFEHAIWEGHGQWMWS